MSQAVADSPPSDSRPRRIPVVHPLELVSQLQRFRMHTLDVTRTLYERYGPVALQEFGIWKQVHLFGPEENRMLLLDRDGNLSAQRSWNRIMGRIFSNGLLLRDGDDHRHHRNTMRPAFRRPALRTYGERMNPAVASALDGWRDHTDGFQAFPAFKQLTLDLACTIFLGIELGPAAARLNRAFEDTVAASMSVLRLPLPGLEFNRGLQGRKWMLEYFGGLLAEKRGGEGDDLFSRLCRAESEDGRRFSDTEILDHLIFTMMAAHDTTTSTLTSLVYELAKHPEWQERVREESLDLGGDGLAFDDMPRLQALNLCLQETLRRYPPLSTIPRVATRSFLWDGYQIPADAMVVIYPLHTHHMPEWWSAPFEFDPERFAEPRAEHRRHTHSYLPFGGGEHMCLGLRFAELQIRIVLFHLTRRFRWSVPPDYRMPVQQAPISKPTDGLPLHLTPL